MPLSGLPVSVQRILTTSSAAPKSVVRAPTESSSILRTAEELCGIRQLFDSESSTYTYLLEDRQTKAAIIIDPVLEKADRDASLARELDLNLLLAINTHCHADHVTGTHELKKAFPGLKSAISRASRCKADVLLEDGEAVCFGGCQLLAVSTPGHTDGCTSFYLPALGACFTGDTLLIRGCGRTDFQQGDSRQLYRSVHERLFKLPTGTVIYPAHDYNGKTSSTIGEEMQSNPRLMQDEEQFVQTMQSLNLAYPKKMDIAVPRNMNCGI